MLSYNRQKGLKLYDSNLKYKITLSIITFTVTILYINKIYACLVDLSSFLYKNNDL